MAVTARASSKGRSPGAAMIASTRAPRPARRTIPCSLSAHSPRSASAAWAASIAALASSPAQATTSWRSAARSATAREAAARVGKLGSGQRARQHLGQGELADQHVGGHAGQVALHPVDLVAAHLGLLEPAPDGVEVAVEGIDGAGPPPSAARRRWPAAPTLPARRPCPQSRGRASRRPAARRGSRATSRARRLDDRAPRRGAARRHGHHRGNVDQPCDKLAHAAIQALSSGIDAPLPLAWRDRRSRRTSSRKPASLRRGRRGRSRPTTREHRTSRSPSSSRLAPTSRPSTSTREP
jgi:hypothetical protein